MIKSIKSIFIFLLISTQLAAQSKYSLSGTISDAQNGEALFTTRTDVKMRTKSNLRTTLWTKPARAPFKQLCSNGCQV
jgi:hypothetical protein